MTLTLPGYANPKFLGEQLANQFPAMRGRTQVVCVTPRRSGPQVTVMTNAAVSAEEVKAFIIALSRQTVDATQSVETVLTPDQQPKARRK